MAIKSTKWFAKTIRSAFGTNRRVYVKTLILRSLAKTLRKKKIAGISTTTLSVLGVRRVSHAMKERAKTTLRNTYVRSIQNVSGKITRAKTTKEKGSSRI